MKTAAKKKRAANLETYERQGEEEMELAVLSLPASPPTAAAPDHASCANNNASSSPSLGGGAGSYDSLLLDLSSELLAVIDISRIEGGGKLQKCNLAWQRVLDWTPAELSRASFLELVHPEDREAVLLDCEGLLSPSTLPADQQQRCWVQLRLRHRNGSYERLHCSFSAPSYASISPRLSLKDRRRDGKEDIERSRNGIILLVARQDPVSTAQEAHYRRLTELAPVGIFETDPLGRCQYVNVAWRRKLGMNSEEAHGFGWLNAVDEGDIHAARTAWTQFIQPQQEPSIVYSQQLRMVNQKTGKVLPCHVVIIPETDSAGAVVRYVGCLKDVSQTVKLEQAKKSSDFKSKLLTVWNHEARTPLNGILGMCDELRDGKLCEEDLHVVRTIEKCANSLLRTISETLDLAALEADSVKLDSGAFDLVECIQSSISCALEANELEKSGSSSLPINCEFDPALPRLVEGDRARVKQVLCHLIGNAVKFSKDNSQAVNVIAIHRHMQSPQQQLHQDVDPSASSMMSEAPSSSPTTAISQESAAEAVETASMAMMHFSVYDTGIGIPDDHLSQLFEPFSQVDQSTTRAHHGTGIGLALCRRLVQLMGGDIKLESVLGQGTIASFWIPLRPAKEKKSDRVMRDDRRSSCRSILPVVPLPPPPPPNLERQLSSSTPRNSSSDEELAAGSYPFPLSLLGPDGHPKCKILVAEDNAINQRIVVRMLDKLKFRLGREVHTAWNGQEAVECASKCQYDVILMDICMPVMDGYEAVRQIRQLEAARRECAEKMDAEEKPPCRTLGSSSSSTSSSTASLREGGESVIIALTANVVADENFWLEKQLDGCLMKPLKIDALRSALAKHFFSLFSPSPSSISSS